MSCIFNCTAFKLVSSALSVSFSEGQKIGRQHITIVLCSCWTLANWVGQVSRCLTKEALSSFVMIEQSTCSIGGLPFYDWPTKNINPPAVLWSFYRHSFAAGHTHTKPTCRTDHLLSFEATHDFYRAVSNYSELKSHSYIILVLGYYGSHIFIIEEFISKQLLIILAMNKI